MAGHLEDAPHLEMDLAISGCKFPRMVFAISKMAGPSPRWTDPSPRWTDPSQDGGHLEMTVVISKMDPAIPRMVPSPR